MKWPLTWFHKPEREPWPSEEDHKSYILQGPTLTQLGDDFESETLYKIVNLRKEEPKMASAIKYTATVTFTVPADQPGKAADVLDALRRDFEVVYVKSKSVRAKVIVEKE